MAAKASDSLGSPLCARPYRAQVACAPKVCSGLASALVGQSHSLAHRCVRHVLGISWYRIMEQAVMGKAFCLAPPASKRVAALHSTVSDDACQAAQSLWRKRRDEISALIWAAFSRLSDRDREFWAHCVWRRCCVCSLARDSGLSAAEVRGHLKVTARYLDAVCQAARSAAGDDDSGAPGSVTGRFGASGRKLAMLLRGGGLHCVCAKADASPPATRGEKKLPGTRHAARAEV